MNGCMMLLIAEFLEDIHKYMNNAIHCFLND